MSGDNIFYAKNGINANGVFTANSTLTQSNNLNVSGTTNVSALNVSVSANISTANVTTLNVSNSVTTNNLNVGSSLSINTSVMLIGNSTVYSLSNSVADIWVSPTGNQVINSTTASIGNTTVNTVVNSSSLTIGGNLTVNSTVLSIGNSSVNAIHNSSALALGNVVVNTTQIFIGNTLYGVTVNSTSIFLGNSTVFTLVNATSVGGSGGSSGNATYLQGLTPTYFTNATNISTGTLPYAQLGPNVVNTSAAFTITGVYTHNANLILGSGFIVNGSIGTVGQVLTSNGLIGSPYWANSLNSSVGGTNTQILFNDSATTNGTMGFTINKITNVVSIANTLTLGANVSINTLALFAGNSSIYSTINSTSGIFVSPTSTALVNSTFISVGNSSVNVIINSSSISINNFSISFDAGTF